MNQIEQLIADLNISPAELARRLGVSEATISRWRKGTHAPSGLYAERVEEMQRSVLRARLTGSLGRESEKILAMMKAIIDDAVPEGDATITPEERAYRQGWRDALATLAASAAAQLHSTGPTPTTLAPNAREEHTDDRSQLRAGLGLP